VVAGLGRERVRDTLRRIREVGWDQTAGDVPPSVSGIAAPIFDNRGNVLGSLSMTMPERAPQARRPQTVADRLTFCARVVSKTLVGSDEKIQNHGV
jgi:DNA-binding IclR family transcriptional regulator